MELLTKIMKMKLRSAPCRNKGFVLDGYPRSLQEANLLFLPDADAANQGDDEEENEEDLPEGESKPPKVLDETTKPDHVIQLRCSKDKCTQRCKGLSADEFVEGHNDADSFERRWKLHTIINDTDVEKILAPTEFYLGTEILDIPEDVAGKNLLKL